MTTHEIHDHCGVPSTLLRLVQGLTDELDSEGEVVQAAARLVNTGAVRLTGNFRGQRLPEGTAGWGGMGWGA